MTPRWAKAGCLAGLLTGTASATPVLQIQTSYNSHVCLDIFQGSTEPGYGVDLFNCLPGTPHENFLFQKNAGGTYRILPQNGGHLCLDAQGIAGAGGTRLVQNACADSRSQEWTLRDHGDGSFSILTADGADSIRVQGLHPAANRTPVLVSNAADTPESRFFIDGMATKPQAPPPPATIGDRTIGPSYVTDPALTARAGVPKGTMIAFTMNSRDSRIFPGRAQITGPFTRAVWVYVPHKYVKGTAIPFMVSQDAGYRPQLPTLLDNAISDRTLPVMAIVFVGNGGGGRGIGIANDQGTERNLEYDTVSPLYAEWVESELLPRVEAESRLQLPGQALTLTSDPAGRGTIGCSSGAAAAFTMAWFKPRSFSKVLSYSGSFTNLQYPADPATPDGAAAYAERLVRDAPRKPIRIWMEVGTRDMDWSQWGQHLDWQAANRDLAGALAHKAYDYHFDLAQGAGHCGDARPPDQTLGEAMHWLWQGYPIR